MVANAFYQLNNPIYRKHKLSFISLAIITLVAFSSVGCGKKDEAASTPQMPPMPDKPCS